MKTSIIYLLGAGRSGTTLLATVLNSHPKITTVGEMHQFFEHLENNKECSCGEKLNKCVFWKDIVDKLNLDNNSVSKNASYSSEKEKHTRIIKYLIEHKSEEKYASIHENVFKTIQERLNKAWLLDSSKYIARYLLLRQNKNLNVKGIYVVRDVRGVINSFGKNVQTTKTPLAAIVYYLSINILGQITCWLHKDILKVRYEDFVEVPEQITNRIYQHLFEMPHIIGGNRMKSKSSISIRKDENWKKNIKRSKQILFYFLSFPIMVLNKYKL